MAVIRCPNCGKPNPDFLEVCQYCDARLHTADGAPVDSRPASPAEDTLVRPPAPRTATPEPEPAPDDSQPADWMNRLRQMQGGEAAEAAPAAGTPADEPDWMWTGGTQDAPARKAASAPPPPTAPAAQDSAADLPEWLRDLEEPIDLPPEPRQAPAESQTPAPARPSAAPPSPAAPPSAVTNFQLSNTPAPSEPSPFEPTASDVTIPPRSRRKMTDWLNKLQELPPPSAPAEPEAPVIPNTDADLPDWLKAMAAEAEAPGSAAPAVEAATQHLSPSAAPTPEDELPDWLRALRAKTEQPRPAPGTGAAQSRSSGNTGPLGARRNQELPESLRPRPQAADETLIPRPGAKPLDAASDDMPDWLKGILSPTTAAASDQDAAAEHPVILTGPAADAARKPGGSRSSGSGPLARETPARETPEAPTGAPLPRAGTPARAPASTPPGTPVSASTTPALSTAAQSMPPASPPAAPPPVPAAPATDDSLTTAIRPAKRLTDWLGKTPAPAGSATPVEELPDWLKSLSAESAAKEALAQPASGGVTGEALPEWLMTTPPEASVAPQPTVAAEPTAALGAPTPPTAATPAPTPAEDLPDWLKAMAPSARQADIPATTAAKPAAPEMGAQAATPPAQLVAPAEDLPDWLKAMAPSAAAATPAAPPPAAAAVVPAPIAPRPALAEPAEQGALALPADDLPDWLKAITEDSATDRVLPDTAVPAQTVAPASAAPAAPPLAPVPEDLPDWLKAITQAEATTAEPAPARVSPPPALVSPAVTLPTPAEPDAQQAAGSDEDLPDWLKAITAGQPAQAPAAKPAMASPARASAVPEPTATAPLTDDLPDWLRAITQASEVAATEATAAASAAAADEAETLAAVTPAEAPAAFEAETASAPAPAAPPTAEAPTAEPTPTAELAPEPASAGVTLPPWLIGVGTAPLPDVQELPDLDEETLAWLSESKKAESTPEPAGLDLTNVKLPDEKPDWLDELAAVTPAPAAPTPSASTEPEIAATLAEDMPDWLRTMRSQPGQQDEPTSESTPDWLRALRGQPAGTAAGGASVPPATPSGAATTPAAARPAGPAAAPEPAGLSQAALPAWLAAMRPVDIEQPGASEADSYEETLGVLAGMRGVLRAEPAVAQPHKAGASRQSLAVSDAQNAQVNILTELLRPETSTQTARRGRVRLSALAERWVVFVVLLAALMLAQFQAQLNLPVLFSAPAASLPPESAAVYNLIEGLPKDKPALVAFDYDAGQSGELDPGAQAVVGQLAHRGVAVVAVSLQLTGPALAEQVLSRAATSGYVNLGYIAGGPVGLLQFAADPRSAFNSNFAGQAQVWSQPVVANVHSLADFGLIVLVSGTPESTRAWVEQAQLLAANVPTVAVVSAGAEPMVRPYYDDPSAGSLLAGHLPLKGLIVGLGGAAAYEQATSTPGAATALWPAMGGGLLGAALIILLGNLFFGAFGALRRRRA